MDVFIARQPIFDRRMQIYGYELLYRHSSKNSFEFVDDDVATAEVLYNAFFVVGIEDLTNGTRAFINFSKELIDSNVPLLLPKERIVVEVLERSTATQATVEACKKIRDMGYKLALDDFVSDDNNLPLIEMADIIKVEFSELDINMQRNLIKKYKNRVLFLAEKIETREQYNLALELGYDLFQGFFFSKPSMIRSKEIVPTNAIMLNVINELSKPEPNYKVIAEYIGCDLALSYKLLKLVNSVYMGVGLKIKSIRQAIAFLGVNEMFQWISLIMLKDMLNDENAELIRQSIIRGNLMSSIAQEMGKGELSTEYFLTGLFSLLDVILNRDMESVISGLPLSDIVKDALLGQDNSIKEYLDCIIVHEKADWDTLEQMYPINVIGVKRYMSLYLETLKKIKSYNI